MRAKTVSIIIPVYNEERFIESVIKKVLKSNTLNLKKEIIIVNDGSTDNTKLIIKKILKKKGNILVINNGENIGKGASLKKGIIASKGDIVLVQDADLEYSPDNYPTLLMPFIKNDADAVYGSRLMTGEAHRVLFFWHYMANKSITALSNIFTNLNLTDMETGYKVFNGKIIREIAPKLVSKKFGFEPEVTAKISKIPNIKIYEVGISYSGRTYSEGKKITWKDGVLAIFEIFRFNLFK